MMESGGRQETTLLLMYPYQQLAERLRAGIRDGTYPPGSKLPSRAQLRAQYECSDIVVGAAMRLLRQDGLIETLPGVGVYVADPLPPP